jgi:copper chaperone
MYTFNVEDMTCGHCASSITAAVHAQDPAAQVRVDLALKWVQVESTVPAAAIESVIRDAGYTPRPLGLTDSTTPAARASGCCCGTARPVR